MAKELYTEHEAGYEALAIAVVRQAVTEYEKNLKRGRDNSCLERFFLSQTFEAYAPSINGADLIKQLNKNFEKGGTCYASKGNKGTDHRTAYGRRKAEGTRGSTKRSKVFV